MTKPYRSTVATLALLLSAFFSASAATPPKVVFIGDYFTYMWTDALTANPNWINKGNPVIYGGGSDSVLARFQSDVVSLHPAVVHIIGG